MSRTISRASSLINTFYLFAFLVLCIVHCPPGLMAVSSLRLLSLAFALKLSPFLNICLFLLLNTRSHFNISNCISYNLIQHWKHNSGLNNNTSLNQIRWNYVNFYIRSNSFFNWSYKPKITIFVTFLRACVCVRTCVCVYAYICAYIHTDTCTHTHTFFHGLCLERTHGYMRKNGGSDATVWFFVVGYDFGNQECSVNTHSSIPGLHVLAWFQHVDSINGYLKYTPFSIFYAIVWGWKFLFSPHQNLSVPSYPKLYLRSSS